MGLLLDELNTDRRQALVLTQVRQQWSGYLAGTFGGRPATASMVLGIQWIVVGAIAVAAAVVVWLSRRRAVR